VVIESTTCAKTLYEFVLSECAGLVRAQHIHASQFLNRRQAGRSVELGYYTNAGKATPKPDIRPSVQLSVGEEQDARSLLLLEGLPVARKCPAMSDGQRWRGRGMLLRQVVSPDIEDRPPFYFEKIS
jgi:hypothetical protein